MDGLTMAAYSLAIGIILIVMFLVLFVEIRTKKTKSQQQDPARLNDRVRAEINAILEDFDWREEQLL